MAGHSALKTRVNALMSRPSTSFTSHGKQDADARDRRGHDEPKVLSSNRSALSSGLCLAPETMCQDFLQHSPLDRLVGRGRLMPPEAIASHGLGCCHEPGDDRREIRIRVVEAEDQTTGADPA